MDVPIRLNNGAQREGKTRYRTTGAEPRHDTLQANIGESLASITVRAYGANTYENQQRIKRANSTLTGMIRIPR